jgi:hypothetical protein
MTSSRIFQVNRLLPPQSAEGLEQSSQPTEQEFLVAIQQLVAAVNSETTSVLAQGRDTKATLARIERFLEAQSTSVIYFAIKKKRLLAKIGHTHDWERQRKEHERKGWEVMAFQVDVKKTEDRFKSFLKSQGIDAVGGKGFDEVYPLNDAFLQCARNFQWPLGIYTKPVSYRRSTNISRPGPTISQGQLPWSA